MSKTSQRKQSLYRQGYMDGRKGYDFRWRRHPHRGSYRKGYLKGRAELDEIMQHIPIEGYDEM